MKFSDRIQHAWNAFNNNEPGGNVYMLDVGPSYSGYQVNRGLRGGNERSIVNSIFTRIAIDVASVNIEHVKTDSTGSYQATMNSCLNYALTQEANEDETGRAFILDVALSLIDTGYTAIVPVDTVGLDPSQSDNFDVKTLRVGDIVGWHPNYVDLNVWNQATATKERVTLPKSMVAIIQNPFYNIMNQQTSTARRLINKLNALDDIDDQSSSGKLDLIIQLPYQVRSKLREEQAENRKLSLEKQLKDSKYGIGYIDSSEHVTQLNRPAENNLLDQVKYLTEELYTQLGMTPDILQGTANATVMQNYSQRTVIPLVKAITEAMNVKFISRTARTQGQQIMYFNDVFSLVPASDLADLADKFIRNEIVTANEFRGIIGFKPSDDPKANILQNPNVSQPQTAATPTTENTEAPEEDNNEV